MAKRKRQKDVNPILLKRLKLALNELLISKGITWGCIYKYDIKNTLDVPFGGHTAWKINKGLYVSKGSIKRGLNFFNIDYVEDCGLIEIGDEKTVDDEA